MNPAAAAQGSGKIDPVALQHNSRQLLLVKALITIAGAVVVGILGVTGSAGFATYAALQAVTVFVIMSKAGGKLDDFIPSTALSLWSSSLLDQLVTYIMFWALAFSLVHIYN